MIPSLSAAPLSVPPWPVPQVPKQQLRILPRPTRSVSRKDKPSALSIHVVESAMSPIQRDTPLSLPQRHAPASAPPMALPRVSRSLPQTPPGSDQDTSVDEVAEQVAQEDTKTGSDQQPSSSLVRLTVAPLPSQAIPAGCRRSARMKTKPQRGAQEPEKLSGHG